MIVAKNYIQIDLEFKIYVTYRKYGYHRYNSHQQR